MASSSTPPRRGRARAPGVVATLRALKINHLATTEFIALERRRHGLELIATSRCSALRLCAAHGLCCWPAAVHRAARLLSPPRTVSPLSQTRRGGRPGRLHEGAVEDRARWIWSRAPGERRLAPRSRHVECRSTTSWLALATGHPGPPSHRGVGHARAGRATDQAEFAGRASRRRRSTAGAPHDPPRHLLLLEPLSLGMPRAGRARARGVSGCLAPGNHGKPAPFLKITSDYSMSSLRAKAQGSSATRPSGKPTAGCAVRRRGGSRQNAARNTGSRPARSRGASSRPINGHCASIAFGLPFADAPCAAETGRRHHTGRGAPGLLLPPQGLWHAVGRALGKPSLAGAPPYG